MRAACAAAGLAPLVCVAPDAAILAVADPAGWATFLLISQMHRETLSTEKALSLFL